MTTTNNNTPIACSNTSTISFADITKTQSQNVITPNLGLIVESDQFKAVDYVREISEIIGYQNILMVTRNPPNIRIFVKEENLVTLICNKGISINNQKVKVRPLLAPFKKLIITCAQPWVPNHIIQKVLNDNNIPVKDVNFCRLGLNDPKYQHILSEQRYTFYDTTTEVQLPPHIYFYYNNLLEYIEIKPERTVCYLCKGDHQTHFCNKSGRNKSNNIDNIELKQTKPNITISKNIISNPITSQNNILNNNNTNQPNNNTNNINQQNNNTNNINQQIKNTNNINQQNNNTNKEDNVSINSNITNINNTKKDIKRIISDLNICNKFNSLKDFNKSIPQKIDDDPNLNMHSNNQNSKINIKDLSFSSDNTSHTDYENNNYNNDTLILLNNSITEDHTDKSLTNKTLTCSTPQTSPNSTNLNNLNISSSTPNLNKSVSTLKIRKSKRNKKKTNK